MQKNGPSVTQNTGHTQNIGNVTPMFGSQCDRDHYICDRDPNFGESKIMVTVTELLVTVTK